MTAIQFLWIYMGLWW